MALGLDSVINEVMAALGANTQRQTDISRQQAGINQETIDSFLGASPNQLASSAQERQGNLTAQDNAIAVRQALGNDLNDADSLMAMMVQEFREASITAKSQRDAVAEKQQVGLLDDPFQFIMNQVTLPDEINALQATQNKADAAVQTIQNMQSLTSASAAAQKATAQTLTKQSIADAGVVQAAELNAKLGALKYDALSTDSAAITLLNQSNSDMLTMQMQKHSLALQDAAAARSSEMHGLQLDRIKAEKLEDQQLVGLVNAGAASFGLKKLNLDSIKLMMKVPEQKAKIDSLITQGWNVASTGVPTVGDTPGAAIINTLDVGGLTDQQNRPTRDYLARLVTDAKNNYESKNGKITKFTPDIKRALAMGVDDIIYGPVNQKTGKRIETMGAEYKMYADADAPGSLIKAADLPQLVKLPAVKSNLLYNDVLAPAAAAGIISSTPIQVYKLASVARDKGLINSQQLAIGLSQLYKTAAADAYATRGLSKFGLPYRPSYLAKGELTRESLGFTPDNIDWANPASVASHDLMLQAKRIYMTRKGNL